MDAEKNLEFLREARDVLREITSEVDNMRHKDPDDDTIEQMGGDERMLKDHWFGEFQAVVYGDDIMQWPNLSILNYKARSLLGRLDMFLNQYCTTESALTAMCIWECADNDEELSEWLLAGEGASEGRETALKVAPLFDRAWEYAHKMLDYDGPFDWDFVPRMMRYFMQRKIAPQDIQHSQRTIYCADIVGDWKNNAPIR